MLTREPMGAELPRQDTRNLPQDFSFCGLRSGCGSTSSGLGVLEDAFTTPCPIAHGDGRPNCCRLGRDPRAFPGRECSPRGSLIARRARFLVLFLPSAPHSTRGTNHRCSSSPPARCPGGAPRGIHSIAPAVPPPACLTHSVSSQPTVLASLVLCSHVALSLLPSALSCLPTPSTSWPWVPPLQLSPSRGNPTPAGLLPTVPKGSAFGPSVF